RQQQLAPVPHRGPAPQPLPAGPGVPGAARRHDRGRPIRLHPAGRGVHPVRLVLQGGLAEPGRGRARPAHRPGRDQPDPEPAPAPDLALGPLGRLHLLAGRPGARPWRRHRPGNPVGVRAHHRLRRGGDRRGHLALRRRGPGGCTVTSITLSAYRAPELRLPRLLAGVSYYHPTALAEHEELYGPLPLPASPDNTRPGGRTTRGCTARCRCPRRTTTPAGGGRRAWSTWLSGPGSPAGAGAASPAANRCARAA